LTENAYRRAHLLHGTFMLERQTDNKGTHGFKFIYIYTRRSYIHIKLTYQQ